MVNKKSEPLRDLQPEVREPDAPEDAAAPVVEADAADARELEPPVAAAAPEVEVKKLELMQDC